MMVLKGVFFACVVIPPCTTLPLTAPADPYNELSSFETKLKTVMDVKIPESERMWAAEKIEDRYKAKLLESAKKDEEIESLIDQKGQVFQKNNQYGNVLRTLACGRNLRQHMETLPLCFGLRKNERMEKSEALRGTIKRIRDTIKRRIRNINLLVYHLENLCLEYQDNQNEHETRPVGWINRVKDSYQKTREATISFESKADQKSLLSLLLDFQGAANESIAVNVFEGQCKMGFWSWQVVDEFDATPEIKNISMMISDDEIQRIIDEYGKEKTHPRLPFKESRYVKDLLDSGYYFTNTDNIAERYEACFEIFYIVRDEHIPYLKAELEEMWPKVAYPKQVDTLCSAYSYLYNLIGETDHAVKIPLDVTCLLNSTDLKGYMNRLVYMYPFWARMRVPKKNLLFVVKFLGLSD